MFRNDMLITILSRKLKVDVGSVEVLTKSVVSALQ